MATRLQIKRANDAVAPTTTDIEYGELAYGTGGAVDSGKLYTRDDTTGIRIIGGDFFTSMLDHTAGTLTAGSALIANGTKGIDCLLTDKLQFCTATACILLKDTEAAALKITDGTNNFMTINSSANTIVFDQETTFSTIAVSSATPNVKVCSTVTSNGDGDRCANLGFLDGNGNVMSCFAGSHDGTGADNKGQLKIFTNTGSAIETAIEINNDKKTVIYGDVDIGTGSTAKDLRVYGDFQVDGDTTTINTATLTVEDDLITVSKGNDTVANADGSGVEIDVTGATNIHWKYEHTNTAWESNVDIDLTATTESYKIAGTNVLTNNTLGTGVCESTLKKVGALEVGSIASGFGAIDNGTSNITSGGRLKIDTDGTAIDAVGSLTLGIGADAGVWVDTSNNLNINNGTNTIEMVAGDMTLYDDNNDGNPTVSLGSSSTNRLQITTNYHSGVKTLSQVTYAAPSSSAAADAGKHVFSVDDTTLLEIRDSCLYAANGTMAYALDNFKIDGGSF